MQPEQAWDMTPREYFMLYDWRVAKSESEGGVPGMSKKEGDEMMRIVEEKEKAMGVTA